ncbi:MAG: hypothetical protein E6J90_26335 [Deltaproteobacteria bacterium]|nr:MAG: hypothetical protein E6J91_18370 [Deltaproteobacteria bacterium]TMQ14761.1 MAG: hypothetical protein E6J90_26335 [Deltaproteobacteria bacterium]
MSVQYSYTHAAKRLISDAVVLWVSGARETAVHLAGLSAECALKSVLVGLGLVPVGTDGQIVTRSLRLHIDKLFGQFQTLLQGHQGAAYAALLPTPVPQPFHDWLVDHRYVADRQFLPHTFERWMWAAIVISKILSEAERKVPREAQ